MTEIEIIYKNFKNSCGDYLVFDKGPIRFTLVSYGYDKEETYSDLYQEDQKVNTCLHYLGRVRSYDVSSN